MAWSKKHERCLKCGTQTHKHVARGLCVDCYRSDIEKRHNPLGEFKVIAETFEGHRTFPGSLDRNTVAKMLGISPRTVTRFMKLPLFRAELDELSDNADQAAIQRINQKIRRRSPVSHSRDDLEFDYINLKMSLGDMAHKYNCSRSNIHKLLKKFEIKRRDKTTAREIAFNKGKIVFNREDKFGRTSKVTLQNTTVNKEFFKSWSPAMAYVLGVIYTDGSLYSKVLNTKTMRRMSRFSVSQKEPELLQKVLALMESNARLYLSKQRATGNPIYHFSINGDDMYEDLCSLGLKPNKSLSLDWPQVPTPYVRHFIRGCWDGDGSVYLEEHNLDNPCASFISGSRPFVEGILNQLINLGLSETKLHTRNDGRSFDFRFRGPECVKLYHILYDEVPDTMYLHRKFKLFNDIADRFERGLAIDDTFASLGPKEPRRGHRRAANIAYRQASVLVFPNSLSRSTIARMLGIRPRHVTAIMKSPLLMAELQKLSDKADQGTIERMRQEVHKVLSQRGFR